MTFRDPRPGISSPVVEASDRGVLFNGQPVTQVRPAPSLYGYEVKFFQDENHLGTMVMTRQDFVVVLGKVSKHG
jgi:hypothetical protein